MIVVLDPGHGGFDSGAVGNGLLEKNLNLSVALKTAAFIQAHSALTVRLTRTTDVFVSLSARAAFANSLGANFYVAIHTNSGGGTGFESYTFPGVGGETLRLATEVHTHVAALFVANGLPDRGLKTADFAVLRETNMPATLLENGFIDTVKDANLLKQTTFLDNLAVVIGEGILDALGVPHTEPVPLPIPEPGSTFPLPDGIFKLGSVGTGVKQIQAALNHLNFIVGVVDGIYGPKTQDAVRRFQLVNLPHEVDGIYGPHTQAAMRMLLGPA